MKKISVVLTTFNSELFLQKTIDSILNQEGAGTHFEVELCVVDDCSSDGTIKILKKNNLRYFRTKRNTGGPNSGRNIGLEAATGDYICIADHDDVWKSHRIISLLPHLESVPVVTSGYTQINVESNQITEHKSKNKTDFIYFEKNKTFLSKLTKSHSGQKTYLGSILYDSSLKHILFEEIFGCVDYDWILRLFHENASIEVCDSLYYRYVNGNNLSLNELYRIRDFYYSLMFIENYREHYPKEYSKSYLRTYSSRARYHYLMNNMDKARFYFLRSGLDWKSLAYYMTSYFGSGYVKRNFNVFG